VSLTEQLRDRIRAERGRWDSKRMLHACRDAGFHCTVQRARQIFQKVAEANPELLVRTEGTRWTYDTPEQPGTRCEP
jgi:hypothetical protein